MKKNSTTINMAKYKIALKLSHSRYLRLLIYLRRARGKKTPRVMKTAQKVGEYRIEGTACSPNMPTIATGKISFIMMR